MANNPQEERYLVNRCCICDVTDEDNPQAKIALYNGEPTCHQCSEAIYENLEDLSINDEPIPEEYSDTSFLEGNSFEITLPEVPVK